MKTVSHTEPGSNERISILNQPRSVWAVAFACVIAFMGLGLVDPILPAIAGQLHASQSQVELLFTSYMFVTGVAMLLTGFIASRVGPKITLLGGLFLILVFSALAGSSNSIGEIVGFRAGWGLGNALFIATALAVIVGVTNGGTESAVILYEAALGLGISVGPLVGGTLGSISWRGPFYGVAVLMAIGFIAVSIFLPRLERPKHHSRILDPIRALSHGGLLTMGLMALCYNFGFFTLLAYTPFVLRMDARHLGFVFFGWGVLLAVSSVFIAPRVQKRFGTINTILAMLALLGVMLLLIGIFTTVQAVVVVAVVLSGALLGINNTLTTTVVMEVAPVERSIASAGYSFVRFVGGAIAPWLAGTLAEAFSPHVPYFVGTAALVAAIVILSVGRRHVVS
ncbi:MAG TPA: MFS transporter [Spirochaetia bacterium]|nr:MFS transporter [Spirochaetia bacterium]